MKFNTITYFIGDAFRSLKRNTTISLASIITVLITFMVLGIFSIVAKNADVAIIGVEEKVELKVFLKEEITLIEKREIEVQLREQPGVKEINYESKEDAYKNFEESMEESQGILQGYTLANNPFPESYIIKMEDPSYAEPISEAIKDLNGIESVNSQQDLVNTVQKVVKAVRIIGIVLFVILIAVSIFLIMNTTKLTVYSRRREVGIMKFVGATDWFIRWPFIIEGMVIALVGAILSTIVLFILYKFAFGAIASKLLMVELVPVSYVFTSLMWKFGLGSLVIGGLASHAALRKFLIV
jgi:cell division transport system permease protein